ncbi:MAG: DUF4097 family beta strand repeat-containing protein [Clostridia bacterium]|nr:DUF4097 family beta strand repeat-containing protein [Clostridia bacterium]
MTNFQKVVRYIAIGLAALLTVSIVGGIISAVGFFGRFMQSDATTDDMKIYTISSEIKNLYIDINAADITLKQGETFSVKSNLKNLTVKEKNGILNIKDSMKLFQNYNNATLIITIPTDTEFEKAELKTGAGRLTAHTLCAEVLDCEFGAGEVKIDTLSASNEADIDGGAGKITISGGRINNLDFDMGVGRLNFTSRLTGECDFDLGVGESNITLLGTKDDYILEIEKGLGNITVDGDNITNTSGLGNGQNKVDMSGGIGAINVMFKEINFD